MSFLKEISMKEYILLATLGIGGYFLYSTKFLMWLNSLNAYQSFGFSYGIIFLLVFILSKIGFSVGSFRIESWKQTIGVALILFAIFTIIKFENPYVQYITKGNLDGASNIFYGSEDGVVFSFWHDTMKITNMTYIRYLLSIVTPVLFALVGCLLARKPKLSLMG